ncbi:hypothetical protein A2673_01785 [Candidatus Kaiserbacteria bacterium RIFCSPHIGHO2_01_FULL_50_13]|uniref:Uncharacterized protein n=1 Tax=Candidatus Kaiserbacteria bacterium RIFCSPLOWO2_01_FULL_50_24 TaxID=1798507 RepID=A0A1F6EIH2_9BACT|nr:MAG: hypothetical protein A2673_01785 [Candidatus Kaiserbacteria bacterium RIFCSPHIGHO2_01_FULL_50_13]OGG73443.1 MAG: hypothetical protein A3A34_02490 [Candidatus Kaiserbacteria bacterium RIFCSPLOWO2_01_FULL_50_24]OGG81326.1 MAG: hypothetical protein A3H74_02085 [Candidatus Kaiserbacteria bacterium RIFCSPLOWO2_02_FULL_51_13]
MGPRKIRHIAEEDDLLWRRRAKRGPDDDDSSRTKVLSDEEQLEDEPDAGDPRPLDKVYPR